MHGLVYEIIALVVLAILLIVVVVKPKHVPEGFVGLVGAGLLVAVGATSPSTALAHIEELIPTILFLGFCLILAGLCQREGLFSYLGNLVAQFSRGSSERLFAYSFMLSALVTATLSLDTTILLLTPVIFATTRKMHQDYRPYVYATGHLANTASLLLPVSNLTNLLAMNGSGVDFLQFSKIMVLPWIAAVATEFLVLRFCFRKFFSGENMSQGIQSNSVSQQISFSQHDATASVRTEVPLLSILTVSATLIGFLFSGKLGLEPFWVAAAGCVVLVVGRLIRGRASITEQLRHIYHDANISFLLFVLSLAVVVAALSANGIGGLLAPIFDAKPALLQLLTIAAVSAFASNVLNNLPAAMLLIPLAAPHGTAMVMAVLIGVNIGPNLTYAGSLATILWRRIVHSHGERIELARFTGIGVLSVPLCIIAAVTALWLVI